MIDSAVRFVVYVAAGVAMAWIGLFAIVYPSLLPADNRFLVLLFLFGGSIVALWLANSIR